MRYLMMNKKDDFLEEQIQTASSIQLDEMLENDILKMMDYVKGDNYTTRSFSSEEPIDGTSYRVYLGPICSGSGGNCLPDVVIISQPRTRSSNVKLRNSIDLFKETDIGKKLNQNVENNSLNLEIKESIETRTVFLLYSNPKEKAKSMIIPLVEK